ncbi:hypothetical protein BGZ50_001140, partial [Haplosporangium sp. Z 11]
MSTPTHDTIQALQEQMAQINEQLARLQGSSSSDPQIQEQRPIAFFHPSEAEALRYPPIKPSDPLCIFKNDVPDEEYLEQFRAYPKNYAMGYDPPKVPSIIHRSTEQKAHDNQLYKIQQRIAHLTRPVDLFLHQVWSLEDREQLDAEEMVELCSTFAILIREQLAAIAGRVGTMRMDNLKATQGANFKQDSLDMVDPQKFQEEIKSIKAITRAFQSPNQKYKSQQGKQNASSDSRNTNQQRAKQDQYRRDSNYTRRDNNSDRRPSFQRANNKQRG